MVFSEINCHIEKFIIFKTLLVSTLSPQLSVSKLHILSKINMINRIINNWEGTIIACLTLGLAPYVPEPHILGKIRWVIGGAIGMQPIDWFDLVMHGAPFILLIRLLILKFIKISK